MDHVLGQADDGDQLTDSQTVVEGQPPGGDADRDDVDRADGLGTRRQTGFGRVGRDRRPVGPVRVTPVPVPHRGDHAETLDDPQTTHRVGGHRRRACESRLTGTSPGTQRAGRTHRQQDHSGGTQKNRQSETPVHGEHNRGDIEYRTELRDGEDGHHHDLGGLVGVGARHRQQPPGSTFHSGTSGRHTDPARILDAVGDRRAQVMAELLEDHLQVTASEPDGHPVETEQGDEGAEPDKELADTARGDSLVDGPSDDHRGGRVADEPEEHPARGEELPGPLRERHLEQPVRIRGLRQPGHPDAEPARTDGPVVTVLPGVVPGVSFLSVALRHDLRGYRSTRRGVTARAV